MRSELVFLLFSKNSSQLTYQRNVLPSVQIYPKQWHSHNGTIREGTQRNSMEFPFLVQCDSLQLKSVSLFRVHHSFVWKYRENSITYGRLGRGRSCCSMLLLQIHLKKKIIFKNWFVRNLSQNCRESSWFTYNWVRRCTPLLKPNGMSSFLFTNLNFLILEQLFLSLLFVAYCGPKHKHSQF